MRRSVATYCSMFALGGGLLWPAVAQAQTDASVEAVAATSAATEVVEANGQLTYPVGYFAQYSPSTALDIIARIPGFSLDSGDDSVRGFGGAAGNLVINGERPSAKSDSLETILSRIPANRVLRVEVAAGDRFGAEYAGRPRVANLVLTDDGGLSGTVELAFQRDFTGSIAPQARASALLRRGRSTFNASLAYENVDFLEEGTDTLLALPSGNLLEFRVKENDIRDQEWAATASWAFDGGENRTANLNGRIERNRFSLGQENAVTPAVGPARNDTLSQLYRNTQWEIGGDITRPFAGGGLKLIGLYRTLSARDYDDSFNITSAGIVGGFVQNTRTRRDEVVARLVWSRGNWGGWTVETGVEGAFNRLDSAVALFGVTAGGGQVPIDLPVDEAVVSEYRGEIFANAGRSIAANLRLDLGLAAEASRLTVSGDATARRALQFFKPRLSLDWRPGGNWRLQTSLTRSVAQLDFGDFIGAAELANDRVDGGNPDLLPQRTWEYRLTVERPVLGDGRVQLTFAYDHISLLQDRVPLMGGGDAPGNLGTGKRLQVNGTVDIPLASLGIRGGRLTATGIWRDTTVRDPYTGQNRFFSGFSKWYGEAGFRQDLGQFAWGVNAFGQPAARVFRGNEIDQFGGSGAVFLNAFAEYRATSRTTLRLSVENAGDIRAVRNRTFFDPDRRSPVPVRLEQRERNQHVAVALLLRHSFQ